MNEEKLNDLKSQLREINGLIDPIKEQMIEHVNEKGY